MAIIRGTRHWCVAAIALLSACTGIASRADPHLRIDVRDGQPWLTAEQPFEQIICLDFGGPVKTETNSFEAGFVEHEGAEPLWVAICPDHSDCAKTVRYGDGSVLHTVKGPQPLSPNHCYFCRIARSSGNGQTIPFKFDAAGNVDHCRSEAHRNS